MSKALIEESLTADGFTSSVALINEFNVSVSGTWTGTLTLQRSFDNGATWFDVKQYLVNEEQKGLETELSVLYRAGFKPTDFTSGKADIRISR